MSQVTSDMVQRAYDALGTGDKKKCQDYWSEDLRWLVPGHNPISGWYAGLDAFLGFMEQVGALSGNSFHMDRVAIMTSDEYSADVTRNIGNRAGAGDRGQAPYQKLDIDVVHVLRWRNGKVIEGRGAIFGDGTTHYDQFWSRLGGAQGRG
jgi:ketosteroid isomerase-like protein